MTEANFGAYFDALAKQDFDALQEAFTPDASLRAITPKGVREAQGRDAIAALFSDWFGGNQQMSVVSSSAEPFEGRTRLNYQLRVEEHGAAWSVQQMAFADAAEQGIKTIDLVCSGFRPVLEQDADGVYRYDAGRLSCGDGLTDAFKRAMGSIPIGAQLQVRAGDASASVELPSFARMAGHEVEAISESEGTTHITVRRGR